MVLEHHSIRPCLRSQPIEAFTLDPWFCSIKAFTLDPWFWSISLDWSLWFWSIPLVWSLLMPLQGLAFPSTTGQNLSAPFISMLRAGLLDKPVFTMWLNPNMLDSYAGELKFGIIDSQRYFGNMRYVNVSSDSGCASHPFSSKFCNKAFQDILLQFEVSKQLFQFGVSWHLPSVWSFKTGLNLGITHSLLWDQLLGFSSILVFRVRYLLWWWVQELRKQSFLFSHYC